MDLDAMCQQALDQHRQRLEGAARRRLLNGRGQVTLSAASVRWAMARILRRLADRLEPAADRRFIGLMRAVAHREIDVDQALHLLDLSNGHRSSIS